MKQCKKCPWKKSTDPHEIPNGYCETKHQALAGTIARPGELNIGRALRVMACHESVPGKERECVGWVMHQLGAGNNLALRLMALDGRFKDYETVGPQHERFEDTLPEEE
jgi:hypothetical protein